MNTRKIIAAFGGVAVIAASVFAAAPAIAEDIAPPAESVVVEETPTPIVEEAPAVEEAPVEEIVVSEVARNNGGGGGHVQLPICHSGSGANWTWIAPDANGYNGHQHHALDIIGLSEAECLAKNVTPVVHKQIGLYCYDKLSNGPASWENSGLQTLAAVKDGDEDWTVAEKRELCAAPEESCEPRLAASQSDWVSYTGEFTFPEHIQFPVDNIGWPPIYKAEHTDLTQTQKDCDQIIPTECETRTVQPTATDLHPQGWVVNGGFWVDGGIEFTNEGWSEGTASLAVNFPLSHAATLNIDSSGDGIFAIILVTTAGNVHFEPGYSDPLWTNSAGILPRNAVNDGDNAGQGGPYSGTLYDLESDPQVTQVIVLHTSGEAATGTLHAVWAFCYEQDFSAELPSDYDTYGDWSGEYDCDDTEITEYRSVTHHTYSFDENGRVTETVTQGEDEERTRELTEEELLAKSLSEECYPGDEVSETDWAGDFGCDATTVTETRTVTTTPKVVVEGEWVLDVENAVSVTESQTRALTAEEIAAKDKTAECQTITKLVTAGTDSIVWIALGVLAIFGGIYARRRFA